MHSNYVWDGIKYILTIIDYFIKCRWIVTLNNKKVETILRLFKKLIISQNILDWIQTDNRSKFKIIFWKKFANRKVLLKSINPKGKI